MRKATMLSMVVVLLVAGTAMAAPSLEITKPPVGPMQSWTGPVQDPDAIQGQWFKHINPETGVVGTEEARTHEFYDNVTGHGGGSASHLAIEGYVKNLVWNGTPYNSMLIGFDIDATITNDCPALTPWADGSNSHNETLSTEQQYVGTLFDTKLTAEFAMDQIAFDAWPGSQGTSTDQYNMDWDGGIYAENHDELGWYCWTPGNPDSGKQPEGDYLVPTWDFGDILLGEASTRTMSFTCELYAGDPRYDAILESLAGEDILLNRTTSLKISNWIEGLAIDTGIPYPQDPALSSDVSVFHNIVPEPMTLCLLSVGGLLLSRKRRA